MSAFGVDLSHWQPSSTVPWDRLARAARFAICRAAYGAHTLDREYLAHVRNARRAGLLVGAYLFYRHSQPVGEQYRLFRQRLDEAGIGEGDMVPALDIEADPLPQSQPVTPAWSGPCEEFVGMLAEVYGSCLVYLTQREWVQMGKPAWVLQRPLWVAHYTQRPAPATPGGKPWAIWQYRVGRYDPQAPGGSYPHESGAIDHNRGVAELPVIGADAPMIIPSPAYPTPIPWAQTDVDWPQLRRDRDALIREQDEP